MPHRPLFQNQTFYHIHNQSNTNIRKNSNDYEYFIQNIISQLIEFPHLIITAYCLLPNQFHLLIKNGLTNHDISNFIKKIQISYTRYHRHHHQDTIIPKNQKIFPTRFQAEKIINQDILKQKEEEINFLPITNQTVKSIANRPYTSIHQLADTGYQNTNATHIKVLGGYLANKSRLQKHKTLNNFHKF